MSRTNDLRKVIQSRLLTLTSYSLKGVYYHIADEGKMYPHIVYDLSRMSLFGYDREDSVLEVDIFDNDAKRVENIADAVEDLLKQSNLPQTSILPTFYLESRRNCPDEDDRVRHINVRFVIQNYER